MKKIVTIAIILLLSSGGWAQENQKEIDQKVVNIENRVSVLEGQQKLFDSAIKVNRQKAEVEFDLKYNEIKKQNSIIGFMFSIMILIGVVVLYQFFWGFKKAIDKKIIELKNQYEIEFNKQAEAAKKALNEAIKMSRIEIDLKKDYRLNILYNGTQKDNLEKLCGMLQSFRFNCISHNQIESSLLNEYDILLFYDDTTDFLMKTNEKGETVTTNKSRWLTEQLTKADFVELKDTCGFFFINKTGLLHNFKEKDIDCFSSANSFATMYENLMSLLHYKRYLNRRVG